MIEKLIFWTKITVLKFLIICPTIWTDLRIPPVLYFLNQHTNLCGTSDQKLL